MISRQYDQHYLLKFYIQLYKLYRYITMMTNQLDPHENLLTVEDYCIETGKITKYIKGKFLGKGGFARCYEFMREDTQQVYAIKIIQKCNLIKSRAKQKLLSQISIHSSLIHENIVKFKHSFQDNLNVYIVLQLCTNSTLNDLFKKKRRFSETQTQILMKQLLDGVTYLHSNKVIHRDLKLGNLFLNQNHLIKIGDFGLAAKIQIFGQKRKTVCGTPNYIAPEILQSVGHSYQADIWSFGVILYTLSFGRPPFESKQIKQTYKKIKLGNFTIPQNCSNPLKNLINGILQKDPNNRLTLKQIKDHQFFKCTQLTRQVSYVMREPMLIKKESYRELSDNGKIYTNINDIGCSQDNLCGANKQNRDKSPQLPNINLDRSNSCFGTPIKQKMNRTVSQKVFKEPINKQNNEQQIQQGIYIKKWIDYSNKYGIGYILNNNSIGVYFNDATKMLTNHRENFYYIQKVQKSDVVTKYSFSNYPPQLKKKINLLNHFTSHLLNNEKNFHFNSKINNNNNNTLFYLKRWFRAKHAIIFRMSNKNVQVIFTDNTQLIINSIKKNAIYFNKNREKSIYLLNEIPTSDNKEVIKRFQYTKQIINSMTKIQQQKKNEIYNSAKKSDNGNIKQKSLISVKQQKQPPSQKKDQLIKTMGYKPPQKSTYKDLHTPINKKKY